MAENGIFGGSDVHSHLQNAEGSVALCSVLDRAKRAKVRRIVCSATRPDDFEAVRRIGAMNGTSQGERDDLFRPPILLTTYGVHPWFCRKGEKKSERSRTRSADSPAEDHLPAANDDGGGIAEKRNVREDFAAEDDWEKTLLLFLTGSDAEKEGRFLPGVGETGLDFALRDLDDEGRRIQRAFFRRQLEIADDLKRPVILHSVRAADEVGKTLRSFPEIPLVLFHGFVGTPNGMERDERVFFSFSEREIRQENRKGATAVRSVIEIAPDRILLESDYPSTRNEPADLHETGKRIAESVHRPTEDFLAKIHQNEDDFFRRWPQKSPQEDQK